MFKYCWDLFPGAEESKWGSSQFNTLDGVRCTKSGWLQPPWSTSYETVGTMLDGTKPNP